MALYNAWSAFLICPAGQFILVSSFQTLIIVYWHGSSLVEQALWRCRNSRNALFVSFRRLNLWLRNPLSRGGVDSFRISSLKTMAVEIYKILNGMDPKYLSALFSKVSTPYNLRDDNKLIQPLKRTTTYGIKTLAYYGTHLWNSLPHDIKGVLTLNDFKTLLRKWVGPTCGCSVYEMII